MTSLTKCWVYLCLNKILAGAWLCLVALCGGRQNSQFLLALWVMEELCLGSLLHVLSTCLSHQCEHPAFLHSNPCSQLERNTCGFLAALVGQIAAGMGLSCPWPQWRKAFPGFQREGGQDCSAPCPVLMALHLFQNAPNKQCEVSGFTMATCAVHLPRHSGFASLI